MRARRTGDNLERQVRLGPRLIRAVIVIGNNVVITRDIEKQLFNNSTAALLRVQSSGCTGLKNSSTLSNQCRMDISRSGGVATGAHRPGVVQVAGHSRELY